MRIKKYFTQIIRRSFLLNKANKRLDDVEFYDLMQAYRHSPMSNQDMTSKRYEAVKSWIRKNYA